MANTLTRELLVPFGSVMTVTRASGSKGFELFNNGPNTIWAALGDSASCVISKSRPIVAGGFWSCGAGESVGLYLTAAVATQLTLAATTLIEVL